MATKKKNDEKVARRKPPALTLEARENQLIAKAVDEAEKRIENGTASDSLLIHWLRQGTVKMQLEKEKLQADVELARAKSDSITAAKQQTELAAEAIKAMKLYTGQADIYGEDYED
jgi:uncharacterized protein YlxW (UPF0749 family)